MGSNQSSSVKQVTDITNKAVTNIVNTNVTKANASQSNTNRFTIELGEGSKLKCSTINLGQKISADQKVKVQAKISSANELKTMLKSAVDNAVSQNNAATNGFLSTAFNNQKSNTEITNILKNEIENNITNENVTECNAVIDNINEGKLVLKKNAEITCDVFKNPQEIATNQLVECFSDALQQAVMNNQNIADAVNKAEQTNTSKNAGADSLLSALMMPFIIIGIVAVIGIGAFFLLRGSPASSLRGRSYSPSYSPKQNINNTTIAILLIVLYLLYKNKNSSYIKAEEKVYKSF